MSAEVCYTINEFCQSHKISRSQLYKEWAAGIGPKFYWVGNHRRISGEAAADYRRRRAEAAAGNNQSAKGDNIFKATLCFEVRSDGGLRVYSDDVPGLVLSSTDIDGVLKDVPEALWLILSERLGLTRAQHSESGVGHPRQRASDP